MQRNWFYLKTIPAVGETATLDESEARHALAAKRLDVGAFITLFDGAGTVAQATLETTGKKSAAVSIIERSTVLPASPSITLAAALPKGDRQATLFSMATQLGMNRFVPLDCERSVARAGKGFASRTERTAIEACKQSRQAHLPTFDAPMSPAACVECAVQRDELVLIADPAGGPLARIDAGGRSIAMLIGPEGGFTENELETMQAHGALLVSLGRSILRIETAAVAALAWARLARID